jgi:UDP-2,3-diacylglucosamine pyrophosphatase LpxH
VAHRRLSRLLASARRLPVDDRSRILFLSDCHRGDGGPTDDLWPNRRLYLDVLTRYFQQGFTYVEVGDGDELWKNRRLAPIKQAHRPIYDLLHEYHQQRRLRLIMGNHDYAGPNQRPIAKEGLPARKALVLQHSESEQEILVAHGHQVDFERDPGMIVSRLGVRYFWRGLQQRGCWRNPDWTEIARGPSWLGRTIARSMLRRNRIVEARLLSWLDRPTDRDHPALICGHTHQARFAAPGQPAYFNTGCCIVPGQITGIVLEAGQLSLIRWTGQAHLEGEVLAGPRPLRDI